MAVIDGYVFFKDGARGSAKMRGIYQGVVAAWALLGMTSGKYLQTMGAEWGKARLCRTICMRDHRPDASYNSSTRDSSSGSITQTLLLR
jgi:hypothetical protein